MAQPDREVETTHRLNPHISAGLRHVAIGTVMWVAAIAGARSALGGSTPLSFSSLVLVGSGAAVVYSVLGDRRARMTLGGRHGRFSRSRSGAARVVVFGAGTGGSMALQAIAADPERRYRPMAVLDDNPDLHGQRLEGVRILGGREALADLAERGADTLLIAVPSVEGPAITELFDLGEATGLDVRTLPPKRDLFDRSRMELGEIREIVESDLLGRRRIDTDVSSIAGYLKNKRVMVTGAGGSIGSELCRQLAIFDPEHLIMLDRDESALHAVQLSIDGQAMLDSDNIVLGDIRDRGRMERIFAHHRPEVVFHAAALKHLPLLERHPGEALLTNVQATVSLLDLSARFGVDRFVNVSSDKAANPISVLGYSKRLSERLTAHYAEQADGNFMSVRFGNVLGSRGSVLTSFHKQIMEGHPLTITHPDVARYFMTVEEAVELVIQAGAIGANGDAMVLDMGEPVRIVDVARRLAHSAGLEAKIVYTHLRPGEKLVEDLFGRDEKSAVTAHPKISACPVPALQPLHVERLDPEEQPPKIIDALQVLCYRDEQSDTLQASGQEAVTPEQGQPTI
ncbi:MAG: polysaccharide biosynthesis protein [Acidimicrobiales bacterium]